MSTINVKRGDPITAELLNQIANGHAAAGIRSSGNISARRSSDGSIQITGTFTGVFVGVVASGGITARSSTTLGKGTVEIWVKPGGATAYVDSGLSVSVDSTSSTTGGVPSTTWVTCGYQDDGTAVLLNVDCGN